MSEATQAAVLRTIEERYGSLSQPSYAFVQEAIAAQPYAQLIDEVSRLADLEETTDANDDVSFRYVLVQRGDAWALDLSMVGPFGLLMRLPRQGPQEVITGRASTESTPEADLVALIERAGVYLLSREMLEREIPLRRPGDEGDVARLYHAVISDEPLLPWHVPD